MGKIQSKIQFGARVWRRIVRLIFLLFGSVPKGQIWGHSYLYSSMFYLFCVGTTFLADRNIWESSFSLMAFLHILWEKIIYCRFRGNWKFSVVSSLQWILEKFIIYNEMRISLWLNRFSGSLMGSYPFWGMFGWF